MTEPAREAAAQPSPSCAAPPVRRLLVVAWHGADWAWLNPLLDAGAMPQLEALIERGCMGQLAAVPPVDPVVNWTSVATGRRPDVHGVLAPWQAATGRGGAASCRVPTLWEIAHARGARAIAVGWVGSHPVSGQEPGPTIVTPAFARLPAGARAEWPPLDDAVAPAQLVPSLAPLRLRPRELGVEALCAFVPDLERARRERPRALATLAAWLARTSSLHAAATWLLEHRDWEIALVGYPFLAGCVRAFGAVARLEPGAGEGAFSGVVAAAARLHDAMLGRLLALAPDAAVLFLSPHGLAPPEACPGPDAPPVRWWRPYGAVCLRAPGVREDERLYGASVLDVLPTALALLGWPVPAGLPGRVWHRAFAQPLPVRRVETRAGDAAVALEQPLEEEEDATAGEEPGWLVHRRAQALLAAGRRREAAALLEARLEQRPGDRRARLALVRLQLAAGAHEEAGRLLAPWLERAPEDRWARLFEAQLHFAAGRRAEGLRAMGRVERGDAGGAPLWLAVAQTYAGLRMWPELERAARRAIERDPRNARAYHLLALALLRQQQPAEAAEAARRSVALLHAQPLAHLRLGIALARCGDWDGARGALETAARLRPRWRAPRRVLARIDRLERRRAETGDERLAEPRGA